MNQSAPPFVNDISEQTFIDLCTWLSDDKSYSKRQLNRLVEEEHYLSLIELANTYWLVGHLNKQLKKHDVWRLLPNALSAYLTKLDTFYLQRSQAIKQEVITVCSLLTQVTPKVVLLKGGATLFNGLADPISARYMADIDILVAKEQLDCCLSKLTSNGYSLDVNDLSIDSDDFHHAPPAIRKNGPCYIELHRRPLVNSLANVLDREEAINTSIPLSLTADLGVHQMHPTQLIIHTIAHSELQDQGFNHRHIDLRQLLNFYLIVKNFNRQICWQTVEQRYAATNNAPVLHAIVFHANKLFGLPVFIPHPDRFISEIHYQKCIQNFTSPETKITKLSEFRSALRGYSKGTITNLYGTNGYFPVFRGRLKHLKRHVRIMFKSNRDL